eukprot:4593469-Amphidinium_carterae.2
MSQNTHADTNKNLQELPCTITRRPTSTHGHCTAARGHNFIYSKPSGTEDTGPLIVDAKSNPNQR